MKKSTTRLTTISIALGFGLSFGVMSVEAISLDSTTLIDVPLPVVNLGDALLISEVLAAPTSSITAWTSAVQTSWQGSISQTGALPSGATNPAGTTIYDFSGLTNNSGLLPLNTFLRIGDLDQGSGTETISMSAYDALGNVITTPWLDEPEYLSGITSIVQSAFPDYVWNSVTGVYLFDGAGETVAGNPSVAFSMMNNVELSRLDVTRGSSNANFLLAAPFVSTVPVPGAVWLFGSGLVGLISIAKRRKS